VISDIKAEIIRDDSFLPLLEEHQVHFFGDGALKCREMIQHKAAFFHGGFHPSSRFMGKISTDHFKKKQFENLAYFEPFYLKNFVATIPGNKFL